MKEENNSNLDFKLSDIENDTEYLECIADLLTNEAVQSMDKYIQHGTTTTLQHCLMVSYISFKIAKKYDLDYKSTARAGLLHDLFLYDWHKVIEKKPLFKKHGFTHPQVALKNACKYFNLNPIEKDIISKHMWPLTFRHIPKYKESIIVTTVDKYCSTRETFAPLIHRLRNKNYLPKKKYSN